MREPTTPEEPTLYLAAPFTAKAEARAARHYLNSHGFLVRARWMDSHNAEFPACGAKVAAEEAWADLCDIDVCDGFVMLNLYIGVGKSIEMGFALAKGKRIWVVGEANHIFYFLPGVQVVRDVSEVRW